MSGRLGPGCLDSVDAAVGEVPIRVGVGMGGPLVVEVTEVDGAVRPDERFVFSAHVQEPGANDNATGVAVQAGMACAIPRLVAGGMPLPARSITFIWGDEISSTSRYLQDDPERAAGLSRINLDLEDLLERT